MRNSETNDPVLVLVSHLGEAWDAFNEAQARRDCRAEDRTCVLKIEVEQEIVETQPTTIAGALVKLALVTARAQSYLGACDPMGREAHEEMTRLLWDVAAASQEAIPFLLQIPVVRDYRSTLASYTTNDIWGAAAYASGTA